MASARTSSIVQVPPDVTEPSASKHGHTQAVPSFASSESIVSTLGHANECAIWCRTVRCERRAGLRRAGHILDLRIYPLSLDFGTSRLFIWFTCKARSSGDLGRGLFQARDNLPSSNNSLDSQDVVYTPSIHSQSYPSYSNAHAKVYTPITTPLLPSCSHGQPPSTPSTPTAKLSPNPL